LSPFTGTKADATSGAILASAKACCTAAKPARPIARLATLFEAARAQMQDFDELVLQWVPRHRNTEADALARMAHSAAALQS
jgi:ribonuclease HI